MNNITWCLGLDGHQIKLILPNFKLIISNICQYFIKVTKASSMALSRPFPSLLVNFEKI